MRFSFKTVLPLIITFIVLGALCLTAGVLLNNRGIDYAVVMGGNCFFFLVSLLVFRMQYAALHNSNPNVFVRSVMAGTMIKLFACIIAVMAYYFLSRPAFNKPALYASMIIYVVYLVVEVKTIMKLNRGSHG